MNRLKIMVTGVLLLIAGMISVLAGIYLLHNRKRRCTEPVSAVCTGMVKEPALAGRTPMFRRYAPEWDYSYNGRTYHGKTAFLDERLIPVRIGQQYELHINPGKPEEIDFAPDRLKLRQQIGIGAFLIFFGGLMLFFQYMGW